MYDVWKTKRSYALHIISILIVIVHYFIAVLIFRTKETNILPAEKSLFPSTDSDGEIYHRSSEAQLASDVKWFHHFRKESKTTPELADWNTCWGATSMFWSVGINIWCYLLSFRCLLMWQIPCPDSLLLHSYLWNK